MNQEIFEELELLSLFSLDNTQTGLKIHHEASVERRAAAKRLFDKDLISLEDGGYLTGHGIDAAEHTRALMNILKNSN